MKRLNDLNDFTEFLKGNALPPPEVEAKILSRVRKALNPSVPFAVSKLFAFHVVGSLVTLLFCPQFGLSLLAHAGMPLEFLMRFHPGLCFVGCGLIWMVGGQALSFAFLTLDEQRVLGGLRWGSALSVVLLSILFFGCLGRLQVDEWLGFWILGALSAILFFNWQTARTLRRCHIKVDF